MASAAVPTWGVVSAMSMAGEVLVGLKASLLLVLPASLLLAQCSVVVIATACIELLTFSWTLTIWMGVPTLVAARFGFGHCIYVQGGSCCSYGGQIGATPLLSFLVLLTVSFKHLTMGEEGLICELGLVLLSYSVPGLMVFDCML